MTAEGKQNLLTSSYYALISKNDELIRDARNPSLANKKSLDRRSYYVHGKLLARSKLAPTAVSCVCIRQRQAAARSQA
eukprot:6172693-Pleurochrysis_carterae.AAC.2